MSRALIRSFLVHLKVRAKACLQSPEAWILLLVFGVTGVAYWPAIPGISPLEEADSGLPLLAVWFLWFWLWPAAPMVWIRGRASERGAESALGICPAPALPVGLRTRAVAEAIFALTVLGVVRWPAVCIYQGSGSFESILATVAGAFFLFPMAVVWALPVRNPTTFMVRPIIVAVLAAGLHQAGGFFATWSGIVVGGLGLTVVALLITGVEVPEFDEKNRVRGAAHRKRKGLKPQHQLSRDAWRPPIKVWGPWVFFAVIFYGVCLYLEIRGGTVEWILFVGFEAFIIITLQPLFRPFNSKLLAESMVGTRGVARGDFIRAWSALPVDRAAVLRRVWLHGVVNGIVLWAVPVIILIVRHRVLEGLWSFRDGVGTLMTFVVVGALFVPIMAGALVAVSLGRRLETVVSGLCLIVGAQVLFAAKIMLVVTFGRGSMVADGVPILLLTALVAAGALPPLRFLRRAPEPS